MTTMDDMLAEMGPLDVLEQLAEVEAQLGFSENHNELLRESMADLELAAEDRGWQRIGLAADYDFSRRGLSDIVRNCRVMAIASPLLKRGLQLRIGYIWGQGVQVQARASDQAGEQDVNQVVQDFWDDESNAAEFTSSSAQEENERTLGTDGNILFALFTHPITGQVKVRGVPLEEVVDKISNPDDRAEPWFYVREYDAVTVRPLRTAAGQLTTHSRGTKAKVIHPALGFRPRMRPTTIDGVPVAWDQPILHVTVNKAKHAKWGVPDAYASLPWVRAYEGFLTDWARLVKALSKFAWKLTGDKGRTARKAGEAMTAARARVSPSGVPPIGQSARGDVGGVAAMSSGTNLEAIPKSGATIDSGSGKPLASIVAAGLGVSVVDLLADPGVTGARAVAETLDKPIVLEMGMRRLLWSAVIKTVLSYVIDQAIKAPRGPLKGSVVIDPFTGRELIALAGDQERTVDVDWPAIDELDRAALVSAIVEADSTGHLPPEVTAGLLLHALRVKDVDEILEEMRDEDGNFEDPKMSAAKAAVDAFNRGEDPASAARGDTTTVPPAPPAPPANA